MRRLNWIRDGIALSFLPDFGGKIDTLRLIESSRNVLAGAFRLPLGISFEDHAFGFDECFPTVSSCLHSGIQWPDHGELWNTPWSFEFQGEALLMEVSGKKAPYLFKRRLTIKETTLRIDYEVVSEKRLSALWSAHPLLRVSPGSRILLPPEVESLLIAGSEGNRLGKPGDRCSWPIFEDISIDVLDHPKKGWADKLFTDALSQGSCGLLDAESEEFVIFRFDPKLTPYLGLWICQGGWPASRPFEDFTVALEPCSGRPDSLAEAAGQDACQLLQPGKPLRWWLEIELGKNPGISIL